MAILSAMVKLAVLLLPRVARRRTTRTIDINIARLITKVRTIAAYSYKKSIGLPFIYPRPKLTYGANFLHMMFSVPSEQYEVDQDVVEALNLILILHADHEQNCSTSTVRMVGSAQGQPVRLVRRRHLRPLGPAARRGQRGGARDARATSTDGGDGREVHRAWPRTRTSGFRLMGFGHRVYKNFDPRAKILKAACRQGARQARRPGPAARHRPQPRGGRAQATPTSSTASSTRTSTSTAASSTGRSASPPNMFTVMFAIGRMPGWIAHWKEMHDDRRPGSPARARSTPAPR